VSAPASESRDTIVIDCAKQEDFPSVCTISIETDIKSSNTLCNKFGSFNKESDFRKHKSVTSKSCYVCGSYLHLIKDCNFHEQTFTKRNAKGKGILKSRPTGKPINPNRPKPVSAGRLNPVSAGRPNPIFADQPNPVSAVNLLPNNSQFFLLALSDWWVEWENCCYSLSRLALDKLWLEKAKDKGIVDSGCSRSMSGNKDKLEDFKDFHGGEVTFGGSTGK
nr:hypothetical protein [Tanacetum cinerariifolium]